MKNIMTILIALTCYAVVAVATGGCSQIKAKKLADSIENVTSVANTVCTSAVLFESAGVSIPGTEKCADVLPLLNREELQTVVAAARCVEKNEPKSKALADCVEGVTWPPVRDRILNLAK